MTGGGSGGHITPILAVAHELKQLQPDVRLIYIGQKGDAFGEIVAGHELIDEVYTVSAGKFRRYHGEGLKQLLDVRTMYLNLRDGLRVVVGLWQSYRLLGRVQPDVVFCKGGFVGVPVGLAAALRHVSYMTHDSDAIPGLANRIIARWAARHTVALDPSLYPYPAEKTTDVGVPVAPEYRRIDAKEQMSLRAEIGLAHYGQILLITGGGLGAARLNYAAVLAVPELLREFPKLAVIHTAGKKHEKVVSEAYDACLDAAMRGRVRVVGYTGELYKYSGAADVVVARGGATNFAELAAQAKACIIVPNPLLTGGHQLKNAVAYEQQGAIINLDETALQQNHELLTGAVTKLLRDPAERLRLSEQLHLFARADSAKELAKLLIELGKERREAI